MESHESIVLTRQALYERVWEIPIDTLCKEFGISNVGLRKVCLRFDIPVPPRGYWAKKYAGHKMKPPPPLPKATDAGDNIYFYGRPQPADVAPRPEPALPPEIAFERNPANVISVPEDLRITHRLLKQQRDYWKAVARKEIRYDNQPPHLNINVTRATERRVLRLLQALFVALESRGHSVEATKDGKTNITVLGETFNVGLREPSKQVLHQPTAKELEDAKKYSWMRPAPYDLVATSELEINIDGVWGTRHHWRDGKKQRLEERLNSVIEGLLEAAFKEKERETERERERIAAEEAARQRQEAERLRKEERGRVRRLERLMEAVEHHCATAAFVAQLHGVVGNVEAESELGRWLQWADDHVKRLDPLTPLRNPQPTISLYYSAYEYTARDILENGFKDKASGSGDDEQDLPPCVVLLDVPYGSIGEALLRIDISEATVLPYEWITETRMHRRFKIPAAVIEQYGSVSRLESNWT